jgi:hypothetical protein
MATDTINNDLRVNGDLSARTMTLPAGSVGNTQVQAAAKVAASKLEGEFNLAHSQAGTVAAATQYLRIIRGAAATLVAVEASVTEAVATGADRTVTVQVERSTGGGAFASVLTAAIVFNNASTLRAVVAGVLSTTALADNDIIRVTVAVAGAAGAQATGLLVCITLREDAD